MESKEKKSVEKSDEYHGLNPDGSFTLSTETMDLVQKSYEKIWSRKIPQQKGECLSRGMTKKGCIESDSSKCPLLKECLVSKRRINMCVPAAIGIIEEKRCKAFIDKLVEILEDKI